MMKCCAMGYPRSHMIPAGSDGVFHCTSRCVRRAYLCGEDAQTGRSYAHRKDWMEARVLTLARTFAVALHSYSVMSNHFHVVVQLCPATADGWSDEDVVERWLSLGGRPRCQQRVQALLGQPERVQTLRERLCSLSWFMRYLKEPIARRANKEDGCTGRFWEGRFDAQALLDESAVLSAMVYVELNPLRAGMVRRPERAGHCSLRRRLRNPRAHPLPAPLRPLADGASTRAVSLSLAEYLRLLDWSARRLHPRGRARLAPDAPAVLERIGVTPSHWLAQLPALESGFRRAVGRVEALQEHARQLGQHWLHGLGTARHLQRLEP